MATTAKRTWTKAEGLTLDWHRTWTDAKYQAHRERVTLTLPGLTRGNLAILRDPDQSGYRLAHQPSGMAPGTQNIPTMALARRIANLVLDQVGPDALDQCAALKGKRLPRDLNERIGPVLREIRRTILES